MMLVTEARDIGRYSAAGFEDGERGSEERDYFGMKERKGKARH